jgi:hypothetical protein
MNKKNKLNIFFRVIVFIFLSVIFYIIFFSETNHFNKIFKKYIFTDNIISLKNSLLFNSNKKEPGEIRYFVQLGIFAKHHEVDKIKARVSILGLKPNLDKYFMNGTLITKVTLGPYTSQKLLKKTLGTLEENNIKYHIINE